MDKILSEQILFQCNNKQSLLNHYKSVRDKSWELETPNLQRIGSDFYNINGLVENIDTMMQLIRSRWFCVQDVILNEPNSLPFVEITNSRQFINEAMSVIVQSVLKYPQNGKLKERTVKSLGVFYPSIVRLTKLKKNVIFKIRNTKQPTCPYYKYFHTLIEVYYYITVLYSISDAHLADVEKHVMSVLNNMVTVYEISYKQNMCQCTQFFWLTIQLFTEKVDPDNNLFWRSFNMVFQKKDPLLSLCFMSELANIQGFNQDFEYVGSQCDRVTPNYQFLELKLKEFLSQANSDSLIICFKSLEPLLCDLWLKDGQINFFQIVWDFYSKRLNVSSVSCENLSALQVIEALDVVLLCPRECTEDFELFIGLLMRHLQEYPVHWGKMKGRIYSQLGPNKIKDLTDIGIKHVIVLFLALSNILFEEMEKKILNFMENLPKKKKFTKLVWNMYAAVILKFVREGRSVHNICVSMAGLLQEASTDTRHYHLIKEFMENLDYLINQSSNMQLHQWQLFGTWLTKYLSSCYFADLQHSMHTIDVLFEKCNNADAWPYWENFFKEVVYSNIKQLATTSENAGPLTGALAGKLALCYNSLMDEAFKIFTSDAVSSKVAAGFLTIILHQYPDSVILTTQQENLMLQCWVKICFFTLDAQREVTRLISKLDLLPEVLKTQLSSTEGDPMEVFITFLEANFGKDIQKDGNILKLCQLALDNINTALAQYLYKRTATCEQVVIQIYQYTSLICLKCGSLIYNRNKPVTILTKLVETLLLPMDFLIGKKVPNPSILSAVKVTWVTFFKAFIQLNNNTKDPYLERTLKDMITKYLPFYPSSDSPIVNSLHNEQLTKVILDKMNLAYFQPPIKETDANLLKALKIIGDITSSTTLFPLFKLVVDRTLFGLFEIVILHSQRNVALSVIKRIIASCYFIRTQTEFREAVVAVAKKHMALNTINCFQLMTFLAKSVPVDIRYILVDIRAQVTNVERQRGVGFDKTLRQHLEKLESCLSNSSNS